MLQRGFMASTLSPLKGGKIAAHFTANVWEGVRFTQSHMHSVRVQTAWWHRRDTSPVPHRREQARDRRGRGKKVPLHQSQTAGAGTCQQHGVASARRHDTRTRHHP